MFDENVANDLDNFFLTLVNYNTKDKDLIIDAAKWGSYLHRNQKRASGEPYYIHPLAVARILVNLKMDKASVIAALLHDTEEDTDVSREELSERYGEEIESLVNAVTKITMVEAGNDKKNVKQKTLQKISIAMSKDIRVILIKLADKLHNMTTLEHKKPSKQYDTAKECLDIFVPLASKLGVFYFKRILENLSLTYIDKQKSEEITLYKEKLAQKQYPIFIEFEKVLSNAVDNSFFIDIKENVGSNYAIYCLLMETGKQLDEVQPPVRINVICETVQQCYMLLGTIHSIYTPLNEHIKDFIALPKENHYRAIHTHVVDKDSNVLEISIRTVAMDREAEFGVLSFWLFEGKESYNPENLKLIQKIKNWEDTNMASDDFESSIKGDLHSDIIFVFTGDGKSHHINSNSTVLDFVIQKYSDKFTKLAMVKVDKTKKNFDYMLQPNQIIDVEFGDKETITLSWFLKVSSPESQSLIRKYFKNHNLTIFFRENYCLLLKDTINKNFKTNLCPVCNIYNKKNNTIAIMNSTEDTVVLHNKKCILNKNSGYEVIPVPNLSDNTHSYKLIITNYDKFLKKLITVLNKFDIKLLSFNIDYIADYKKMVYIKIAVPKTDVNLTKVEKKLKDITSVVQITKEFLKN